MRPRTHRALPAVLVFAVCAWAAPRASAQNDDKLIAQLGHGDPEVRIEALRGLLTSVDPRLPEALLPLLEDSGNSIRRLAARAVGSRWWQIPEERRGGFVAALERNSRSEFEDERNMVRRGVGLLERDYRGPMFARSPDRRWVVYERLNLPCIIDTKNATEELVGWSPEREAWLQSSWGNAEVASSALWHPDSSMVALAMIITRKANGVWVWRPGRALRKIEPEEIVAAVGPVDGVVLRSAGVFLEPGRWDGDRLLIKANYSVMKGEEFTDWEAEFAWDAADDRLALVKRSEVR
jgi:hypothetical protein